LDGPLSASVICHSAGEQGGLNDQSGKRTAHGGACALCCLAQANAALDSPTQAARAIPIHHPERMVWHVADVSAVAVHKGSSVQARAPPQFS
jgi:hypothetical protein